MLYFEEVIMDAEKRRILEASGWRFGDFADFLKKTAEDRKLSDARMDAALEAAIREGQRSETATRDEVFDVLNGKKSKRRKPPSDGAS
jgi:hypothetical protein